MKIKAIHHQLYWTILIAVLLFSCKQESPVINDTEPAETTTSAPAIQILAKSFVEAKGATKSADEQSVTVDGEESWLSYNVIIPMEGRYKFELSASAAAEGVTAWMEDYIGNKDGRTYNITSTTPITPGENFSITSKDGSPLNKGMHKMKLHVNGGAANIEWIKFTLLKNHQYTPTTMTQKTDGAEWKVVWADEFNGEGIPDTSKWTFDIGNWGWGNNELQYYTEHRPKNARQEDGNLIIEAHKDDMGQPWTSARLTTRGKVSFVYGRIEMRAKVPPNRGNWAAGWTLGDEYIDEISWPYCGEIDILESVGYEMEDATGNGKAHASIHCGAYYFKLGNQPTSVLDVKNMHDEYHIYSIDWTPEGITAAVDGQVYFTYNDTSGDLPWPFNKPQNIILNLAMGGGWGGAQGMDESMTTQQYVLDYVRVYEKS